MKELPDEARLDNTTLSPGVVDKLKHAGIATVGDLRKIPMDKIRPMRGIGPKALESIESIRGKHYIGSWKDPQKTAPAHRPQSLAPPQNFEAGASKMEAPPHKKQGGPTKTLNIFQRILGVMDEVGFVEKRAEVQIGAGGYKAVLHDDVASVLRPFLIRYGIAVVPTVSRCATEYLQGKGFWTRMEIAVRFVNVDNPEDYFSVTSHGDGLDKGEKAVGKAFSYAFKYALLKTFVMVTGLNEEERAVPLEPPPPQRDVPSLPPELAGNPSQAAGPPQTVTPPGRDEISAIRMACSQMMGRWANCDEAAIKQNIIAFCKTAKITPTDGRNVLTMDQWVDVKNEMEAAIDAGVSFREYVALQAT